MSPTRRGVVRSIVRRVSATLAFVLAGAGATGCGKDAPPRVASVQLSPPSATLLVGQSLTFSATTISAKGAVLSGRSITWSSSNSAVATVTTTGMVTVSAPGAATITASSEGASGASQLTVLPVPVGRVIVSPTTATLTVNQTVQLAASTTDSIGGTLVGRTVVWTTAAPSIATVSASGLVVAVSAGSTTATASSEGKSASVEITVRPLSNGPPVLSSVSASPLIPGRIATLVGSGFGSTVAANQLSIRGVSVPVLSATSDSLTFVVPCQSSGASAIRVTTAGGTSGALAATLAPTARTLAKGQSLIVTAADSSACNELQGTGTSARYIVSVSSSQTSQNALLDFELAGNTAAPTVALQTLAAAPTRGRTTLTDAARRENDAHLAHLEYERRLYEQLRQQVATEPAPIRKVRVTAPPATGDLRLFYYNFNSCNDSTQTMRAKAIYVGTRSIIWEDSANVLQSAANPDLLAYYQRIGQIFDQDQYDVVKNTFGDPLRRDILTDYDERVHMVFTQRLNGSGAAAYVTSCDALARGTGRWGSNFGEVFYGSVATAPGSSLTTTAQPGGWFAFMVRTVVHEVKHIASVAARFANSAPTFEQSWLEEGTARHAEEVWAREKLHKVTWKGNTGYGTSASNGVYCDFNLANIACLSNDVLRRPSWGMRRQFNEIKPKLDEPWNWSPYGDGVNQSGSIFYNTTWSLVRYTIDRFGQSDAAFFTQLVNGTTSGTTNLTTVAGVSLDRLIGGWGLALYADDYPLLGTVNLDASFATWNLRDIYGALNTDPLWSATYTRPYPIAPVALTFGSFVAQRTGIRGGAHAYFELSGTPSSPQLLDVRALGGGPMPSSLRVAIMRLQ